MKKILLIIILILAIFQMVVLATVIDVGNEAIDRNSNEAGGYTEIVYTNPANASGKITSIEIWANEEMIGVEVAIFYVVSGSNLSTRDTVTLGTVTIGEHSISNGNPIMVDSESNLISLDVVEGDFIGIYWISGRIEADWDIGEGGYYKAGDHIPCTNLEFSFDTPYAISLYGTGTTEEAGNAIMFGFAF